MTTTSGRRLEVDAAARVVLFDGRPVPMSRTSRRLLEVMLEDPTRCWTRKELGACVYGWDAVWEFSRALDSAVSRLRCALRAQGLTTCEGVFGEGWRLLPYESPRGGS